MQPEDELGEPNIEPAARNGRATEGCIAGGLLLLSLSTILDRGGSDLTLPLSSSVNGLSERVTCLRMF